MTSLTYMKYCGSGFGEDKPVQPGERLGVVRELEKNVDGYKALRKELAMLRVELEQQENLREKSKLEKTVRTKYYKSQLGIRSVDLNKLLRTSTLLSHQSVEFLINIPIRTSTL